MREFFEAFLKTFRSEADVPASSAVGDAGDEQSYDYIAQYAAVLSHLATRAPTAYLPTLLPCYFLPGACRCREMKQHERTTLFVDFQHLQAHDTELADAIKENFHYLEGHLRLSVAKVIK